MATAITGLRRAIALVAVITALTTATTTASAGTVTTFRREALAAGLSAAQADALQVSMNSYLRKTGGTQVGANKIDLDGALLIIPPPGETKARDLSRPGTNQVECLYKYFCAYEYTNGNGPAILMYTCREYYISWLTVGSWANNQTPGTRARFQNSARETIEISEGAPSYDWTYDWIPVYYVRPCGI